MRVVRLAFLAGLLAAASLGVNAGSVAAYGAADSPLAQIEYSQNCDNLSLCQGGFGPGGVWLWIEIDGGPTSGTADVAGAGCFHFPGLGGGADPISGEATWFWSLTPVGFDATLGTWTDPNHDGWYVLTFPGFGFASFPVTTGHYGAQFAPGINFELQVAP
jgi:hypothetical protein